MNKHLVTKAVAIVATVGLGITLAGCSSGEIGRAHV